MSQSNLVNTTLYKTLISLGRISKTGHAKRGATIELDGNTAYLINEKHSLILKVTSPTFLGTGTFCSSDALSDAIRVQDRDGKVAFTVQSDGKEKTYLIPAEISIKEPCETALSQYYAINDQSPGFDISNILNDLDPDIIFSTISAEGNTIKLTQTRSDASVRIETSTSIGKGFFKANIPPTGEVSIFTQDLVSLQPYLSRPVNAVIIPNRPISISSTLCSCPVKGLITWLEYEDK